jgi:hypothetical protein
MKKQQAKDKVVILADAFGSSAKMKIPKCTLDQYALIKSHSDIVNSENNLNRMKN